MTESTFDTLARGADSRQGRRHALKAFGAAALATVAGAPLAAEAKKNGKNRKKRKKNRNQGGNEQECPICPAEDCTQEAEEAATARCLSQVAICEQEVRETCDRQNTDPAGEAQCLDDLLSCCQALATCDVSAFFACVAPEESL